MPDISFLKAFWTRFKREAVYYGKGLYAELLNKDIFLWSQAIAFKVLINIVPILILATGVLGQVLGIERSFDAVASFVRELLPPEQSEGIIEFLAALHGASGTITAIGVVGLMLSGVSLFVTLRIAVGNAFRREWHKTRSLFRGYLFDAALFALIGILFVISIGVSIYLQTVEPRLDHFLIQEGWQTVARLAGWMIPFVATTAMFFLLFYFVPKPHPHKRSALVGAVVTAVLWEGAKYAFTLYTTYFAMFDADGLSTLGAVFGLIIVFVIWVYLSAIILMMGAVAASLHENRHRKPEDADSLAASSSTDGSGGEPSPALPSQPNTPQRSSSPEAQSSDRPVESE